VAAVLFGFLNDALHLNVSATKSLVGRMGDGDMRDAMAVLIEKLGDGVELSLCCDVHAAIYQGCQNLM